MSETPRRGLIVHHSIYPFDIATIAEVMIMGSMFDFELRDRTTIS